MTAPESIRIPFEESEYSPFRFVGRYEGGEQFLGLVTGAFPQDTKYPNPSSDWRHKKRWVAVVHRFDEDGNHIRSDSRLGGFDSEGRAIAGGRAWDELEQMLGELASERPVLCDICVRLFSVEIDGVVHGLFYEHVVEDSYEDEYVMLEPRDIMFHPPWDSGEYST